MKGGWNFKLNIWSFYCLNSTDITKKIHVHNRILHDISYFYHFNIIKNYILFIFLKCYNQIYTWILAQICHNQNVLRSLLYLYIIFSINKHIFNATLSFRFDFWSQTCINSSKLIIDHVVDSSNIDVDVSIKFWSIYANYIYSTTIYVFLYLFNVHTYVFNDILLFYYDFRSKTYKFIIINHVIILIQS